MDSRHLHDLCDPDLIFGKRKGKNVFYQTTPGRVRYDRQPDGSRVLTLTTRDGRVGVTVVIHAVTPARVDPPAPAV